MSELYDGADILAQREEARIAQIARSYHLAVEASRLELIGDEISQQALRTAAIVGGTGVVILAANSVISPGNAAAATTSVAGHHAPQAGQTYVSHHHDEMHDTFRLEGKFSTVSAIAEAEVQRGHAESLETAEVELEKELISSGSFVDEAKSGMQVSQRMHYLREGQIIKYAYTSPKILLHEAKVKPGETVDGIAFANGETEDQFLSDNKVYEKDPNYIQAGAEVKIDGGAIQAPLEHVAKPVVTKTKTKVSQTTITSLKPSINFGASPTPSTEPLPNVITATPTPTVQPIVAAPNNSGGSAVDPRPLIIPAEKTASHLRSHTERIIKTKIDTDLRPEIRRIVTTKKIDAYSIAQDLSKRVGDLKDFHPETGAQEYFDNEALPMMIKNIPIYMKAAALEGVPDNWELLAALNGPELNFQRYYKWNGIENCKTTDAGPAGPYQETSCVLVPYLNDPEFGPVLKTLITPEGEVIPHAELNDAQMLVMSRLAFRHWILPSLKTPYGDMLEHGPIPFSQAERAVTWIMSDWNEGATRVEGFNGFSSAYPYNPTEAVNPGMGATYFMLKKWEADGGLKRDGVKIPKIWFEAMKKQNGVSSLEHKVIKKIVMTPVKDVHHVTTFKVEPIKGKELKHHDIEHEHAHTLEDKKAKNTEIRPDSISRIRDLHMSLAKRAFSSEIKRASDYKDMDQGLAKEILADPNIAYDPGLTEYQFQRMAAGEDAETDDGRQVDVEPIVLVSLLHLAQGHTIQISALTNGQSHTGLTNPHGEGKAVDVDFYDGHSTTGSDSVAYDIIDHLAEVLPDGSRFGMGDYPFWLKNIKGKDFYSFLDNPNHIHFDVMGVSQTDDDAAVEAAETSGN